MSSAVPRSSSPVFISSSVGGVPATRASRTTAPGVQFALIGLVYDDIRYGRLVVPPVVEVVGVELLIRPRSAELIRILSGEFNFFLK